MKKLIGILSAFVLLISLAGAALSQGPCAIMNLEGLVLEKTEEGSLLVDTISDGEVLVKLTEETVFEGEGIIRAGDYILIDFNGMMTRSLPPQVTAMKISRYVLEGRVISIDQAENTLLMESDEQGQVIIRLPELDSLPAQDDYVRVYFNGIMALSYPGQAYGAKIDIMTEGAGLVTDIGKNYFLMEGETGEIRVNTFDSSRLPEDLATGQRVRVYYSGIMTRSLPPQIFAETVKLWPAE